MSLSADALQTYMARELSAFAGRAQATTLTDIIISERAAYSLGFDDADQSITLDFREPSAVVDAFAGDCCRLSFAAFQTIAPVSLEIVERDTVAWSLVKIYYAAFYAGQALIRIFGESCSFFDRRHVTRLIELGEIYGLQWSFSIHSGLYRCVLSSDSTALKCTQTRGAAGIHDAFWTVFGTRIQKLAEATLTGTLATADAQSVYAQLDRLTEIMRRRTGYSWLSNVRNDLQYRQHYGVWFPARLKQGEKQSLGRLVAHWNRDPMEIRLDERRFGLLGDYVTACYSSSLFVRRCCGALLNGQPLGLNPLCT
jgi:hypothetical protein